MASEDLRDVLVRELCCGKGIEAMLLDQYGTCTVVQAPPIQSMCNLCFVYPAWRGEWCACRLALWVALHA